MNKKSIIVTYFCLLLVGTLILGWQYISIREEKNFLQDNIDQMFYSNLSSLYTNLYCKDSTNMDEERLASYNTELAICSKLCWSLFSISSYSGNIALQDIMRTMVQMAPPNVQYQLITDSELLRDIGYLLHHLESEELANEVWEDLSQQVRDVHNINQ